jgi:acetylornithine/succinyldiaminopimelate/putrescine aminotransferase
MDTAVNRILEVLRHLHTFGINPLAGVIVAALLAALIEQRMARRRTPDFSTAYRDIKGAPPKASPPR